MIFITAVQKPKGAGGGSSTPNIQRSLSGNSMSRFEVVPVETAGSPRTDKKGGEEGKRVNVQPHSVPGSPRLGEREKTRVI